MKPIAWWFLRRSKTLRRLKRGLKSSILDRPRRVPKRLGVQGLFQELDRRGCTYVVLRWFDDLPQIEPEGDLDILVADEDAESVAALLTRSARRGSVSCDLYSASGLPGFEHRRHAYYPPHVAEEILSRAVRHPSGALVPAPEDHFFSLAFHALYHKGYGSGLPVSSEESARGESSRHDYTLELRSLAGSLDLSIDIDMSSLDQALESRGWRPPPDTLMKWAAHNPWCRDLVEEIFDLEDAPPGLAVLLVREAASHPDDVNRISEVIDEWGFVRLGTIRLDAGQQERATRLIRGGNWGRGPWPQSGGVPAVMIVARDPTPSVPSAALQSRHPGVDNGRIFEMKDNIRDMWNDHMPVDGRSNIVHASDNSAHAMHYLETLVPEGINELLKPPQGQQ